MGFELVLRLSDNYHFSRLIEALSTEIIEVRTAWESGNIKRRFVPTNLLALVDERHYLLT
jgi:hypothetical protein